MRKNIKRFVSVTLTSLIILLIQVPTLANPKLKFLKKIWNSLDELIFIRPIWKLTPVPSAHIDEFYKIGKKYALKSMRDNNNQELTSELFNPVQNQRLIEELKAQKQGYALSDKTLKIITYHPKVYEETLNQLRAKNLELGYDVPDETLEIIAAISTEYAVDSMKEK